MTALAPPKLLEKMSELLTQHGDLSDRGFCSARLAEAMLPHLDEQEQASFHGVLRRLDTLADALIAKVGTRLLSHLLHHRGMANPLPSARCEARERPSCQHLHSTYVSVFPGLSKSAAGQVF